MAPGSSPEEVETVVIAPVADDRRRRPSLPEGVPLREVTERRDLERIGATEEAIWHDDRSWLADSLEAERAADPDAIAIVVAEAGDEVVCAGRVRFESGTDFATLWGGGTLPAWRGRGIYRAVVAHRANLAAARGFRYLAGGRVVGQPADPRAAGLRRGDDDDAVRLVAAGRSVLDRPTDAGDRSHDRHGRPVVPRQGADR